MLDTANTVLSETASNGATPAVDADLKEIFRYFTAWGLRNNEVNIDEASQFTLKSPIKFSMTLTAYNCTEAVEQVSSSNWMSSKFMSTAILATGEDR